VPQRPSHSRHCQWLSLALARLVGAVRGLGGVAESAEGHQADPEWAAKVVATVFFSQQPTTFETPPHNGPWLCAELP
jgi:hypothetical protein